MTEPKSTYAPLSDKRKADIQAATAAWRAKMRTMTPIQQAAHKAKVAVPYVGDEEARAEAILADLDRLKAEAEALQAAVMERLEAEAGKGGDADAILKALGTIHGAKLVLKVF